MISLRPKKNKPSSAPEQNEGGIGRFFRRLLRVLNALTLIPLFLAMIAPWVAPSVWWLPSVCALAAPWLLLVPLVWSAMWLVFSVPMAALNIVLLLLNYPTAAELFQFHTPDAANRRDFTVLSFNVKAFNYKFEHLKRVTSFIKAEKPDIVCLQEFRLGLDSAMQSLPYLRKELGLPHVAYVELLPNAGFGLAVFSRYPISRYGKVSDTLPARNGIMYADIKLYGDSMRIYNLHLQSYNLSVVPHTVLSAKPDGRRRRRNGSTTALNARNIRTTLNDLTQTWAVQEAQLAKLLQHARNYTRKLGKAVLVCGDLNNPAQSYFYKQIRSQTETHTELQDAFLEKGRGTGKTYGLDFTSLRIDYILPNRRFDIREFQTLDTENLSDHAALKTRLRFDFHRE